MSSYGYLVVTGMIVVGGFVAASETSEVRRSNQELLGVHLKEEARDAAMEGLNVTIDRLMLDEGPWLHPTDYQVSGTPYKHASFATAVVTIGVGDTVDVTSVGSLAFENVHGMTGEAEHTINVRLIRLPGFGPMIAEWSEQ